MNPELQTLLHRWREGLLTPEEMRALTVLLAQPQARRALRCDWFLDAALPQSLAASAVIVHTPQPSFAAKMRGWFARLIPTDAREEEPTLGALQLWARVSFAALALSVITAVWFVWPQHDEITAETEAEHLAQIIFQMNLPDSQ